MGRVNVFTAFTILMFQFNVSDHSDTWLMYQRYWTIKNIGQSHVQLWTVLHSSIATLFKWGDTRLRSMKENASHISVHSILVRIFCEYCKTWQSGLKGGMKRHRTNRTFFLKEKKYIHWCLIDRLVKLRKHQIGLAAGFPSWGFVMLMGSTNSLFPLGKHRGNSKSKPQ